MCNEEHFKIGSTRLSDGAGVLDIRPLVLAHLESTSVAFDELIL
jgi:hypothetical protein